MQCDKCGLKKQGKLGPYGWKRHAGKLGIIWRHVESHITELKQFANEAKQDGWPEDAKVLLQASKELEKVIKIFKKIKDK